MYNEILNWKRSGRSYDDGKLLFEKYGKDALLRVLLKGAPNSFTTKKLNTYLMTMLEQEAPTVQIEAKANTIIQREKPRWRKRDPIALTDLPPHLLAERQKVATLYKDILLLRKEAWKHIGRSATPAISLEDCFSIMQQQQRGVYVPFTVTYLTYNESTQVGGDITELRAVVRFLKNGKTTKFYPDSAAPKTRVDPRHTKHGTVNVQPVGTSDFRTIHTWCIFRINGIDVHINVE